MEKVKLYLGNLGYSVEAENILDDFPKQIGEVFDPIIIKDRETKRSKGYGFVKILEKDLGKFLDASGTEYSGRKIVIKKAIPKNDSRTRTFDRNPNVIREDFNKNHPFRKD